MKVWFYGITGYNMKIKFSCRTNMTGSTQSDLLDIEKDLNMSSDEWNQLTEDQKQDMAIDWAYGNGLEIWYEEID
jgi:hypothetical protein